MKTVTGMGGVGGARELAEMLRQLGRGQDTVLAHITPEEAQMLMDMGGSGKINPNTGLPEFQPEEDYFGAEFDPYMGMDVTQASGGITPEAEAYYAQGDFTQQPSTDFGRQDQYFGQEFQAEPPMDIGFGPGQFTPQYTRADVAGMPAGQYESMVGEGQFGPLRTAAQGVEDTASQYRQLAREYPTVARLLSTGATTIPALVNAFRSRRQARQAAEEFRQLGAPMRQEAENLRTQALAGQLTPQQAAAQEAARARMRQQAAGRGATTGTQAAMIENQLARSRSELSQTNLNNALKQLNLANAYDEAAIKAKLAADAEIENTLANIFQSLGKDFTGQTQQQQQNQPSAQPRQPMANQPEVTRRPDVRG